MLQKSISKKSSSLTNQRCEICYKEYDLTNNTPLLVCHSNHGLCKLCLMAIRHRPHCPFCRQLISFARIRLNRTVLNAISRRITANTPSTNHQGLAINQSLQKRDIQLEQQQRSVYLDEAEFIEPNSIERQSSERELGECSMFLVLLYIYFVFLQLPLGSLNIYTGCSIKQYRCRLVAMDEIYSELGLSYKTLGGVQIALALHFLYLRYLFKSGRIGEIGQLLFNVILSFFVILKSILSIIIFIKFLHQKNLSVCLAMAGHNMALNLFVNYVTILLGINILLRLCCILQLYH